jgi:hypothetical protein
MKHRWTVPKFRYGRIRPLAPPVRPTRSKVSYCTQCGARTWNEYLNGFVPRAHYWRQARKFYAPFGGISSRIERMPPCEGLPKDYDVPIGA